jgi:hypothetical protein
MTPLEKAEALYEELLAHYGEGEDREIRAAAKLLLVALAKFKQHGGARGVALAEEYLDLLKHDPDKFGRILHGNRGRPSGQWLA